MHVLLPLKLLKLGVTHAALLLKRILGLPRPTGTPLRWIPTEATMPGKMSG